MQLNNTVHLIYSYIIFIICRDIDHCGKLMGVIEIIVIFVTNYRGVVLWKCYYSLGKPYNAVFIITIFIINFLSCTSLFVSIICTIIIIIIK